MLTAISRTPYRVSFFGGGTDYPDWSAKHGGAVLSMAINKYCYVSGRHLPPFFGIRHRIVWSHIETVGSISEILHPAVREGLLAEGFTDREGVELHHQGDLPARSGIGSSSAFAVGLLNVLHAMRGLKPSPKELALTAIALERNRLHEHVGHQDQVASAYGGLNVISFEREGGFTVSPIKLSNPLRAEFEQHLMLFYTGSSRLSSDFARKLVDNLGANTSHLQRMQAMVPQGLDLLLNGDFSSFGELLHESWTLKRQLAGGISTEAVDQIYGKARAAGALGGKLLGAGGTGFMIFIVPEAKQQQVRTALADLIHVPIRVDFTGSTIVYQKGE